MAQEASSGNRPTRRAAAIQGRSVQRRDSRNLDRSIVGKRVRVYWEEAAEEVAESARVAAVVKNDLLSGTG